MSGEREIRRYRVFWTTPGVAAEEAQDGAMCYYSDAESVVEGLRTERDALLETLGRDGQYLKTEATEEERSIEGAAYRGRSVYAWWAKAHAYGCMVHGINPILGAREGEHANDAARRVVAERDAALLRVGELEKALLLIGERAMVDFDDSTVGEVDRVVKEPGRYRDWLRDTLRAGARVGEAEGMLRECLRVNITRGQSIPRTRIEGFLGGVGEGS